jgi:serine protease Do
MAFGRQIFLLGVGAGIAVAVQTLLANVKISPDAVAKVAAMTSTTSAPVSGAGEKTNPSSESNSEKLNSDLNQGRRNALVLAVETVAPAVVTVNVRRAAVVAYRNPYFNDPFFDFFRPQMRKKEMSSLGSGIIVSAEGHILTNAHVLGLGEPGELEAVWVNLPDGRRFPAQFLGGSVENDIAVLKVKGDSLPVAEMQTSDDNMIGEWVVAIGNPFGSLIGDTSPSVTVGVLSAVHRTFTSESGIRSHDMLQTDASINPGNSGGPLVNAEGKVIGVNTFIFTGGGQSQGSIGLGFALPIRKAKAVMDEIIRYGGMREFTTGLYADPNYGWQGVGVLIAKVDPNSPGEKAGLRTGDVIVEVAGRKIKDLQEVQDILRLFQVGEKVQVGLIRQGKRAATTLVLEEAIKQKSEIF